MDFNLKDFVSAIGGGLGLGFGLSSLVPVLVPSVVYSDYIWKCGAISGAVVLSALYLYSAWRAK
ncbi:hypothetical protein WB66_12930 [bacteria symbiont BFo1 of Frankliniella occidentalis]|jgi:ABC-type antimicrobial peptide transport system permease subunit|nr:hypothetical protein AI28_11360 [bacteria symbiont BFo1 of Frankliniella occidentalis]KYP84353.1 hypothetical protein WB66_12930 [bacteria symbiont BFo1 of Frankliniella occidentalis]KYP91059.1 hypothetical protein WB91_06365 [bacteria symbiont BFo1 of Frankliniella occidentalis]PIJ60067.1 hypothetical protein BOM23_01470 [Erwinia sp. OLMDLW33]CAH0179598.1 hypothetical protein SRABI13_01213 [Erwinia aphidicola]